MSGYHAVAVDGEIAPEILIRAVYGLDAGASVEPRGTGHFPWGADAGTAGVAVVGGWNLVCGDFPASFGSDEEAAALAELSRGRRLFRWAVEDASGSVGFDQITDGEHQRGFWSVEGEVVSSIGSPLDGEPEGGLEEAEQSEVDEWTVVGLLEPHLGPWDPIGSAEYRMYGFGG
jgi:hypothetical protein